MPDTIKVAAVQAEPEWNNLEASVNKVIAYIQDAASNGANVLGFPEVFIPGYPWSIWVRSPLESMAFMDEYYHNSLSRESEQMDRIRATVRNAGIFVVLGYSERDRGSLYISQSFIDPTGTIVHHRRKIKPTHVERAFWGEGQAESLKAVVPSPFGNIGGLNCWEHTQPLLRYYEYTHDVDIHVGSWPLAWDMPPPEKMPWTYQLTPQMCMTLPQVLALEGACFVLVCSQVLTEKNRERCRLRGFDYATTPGGGFSMIFGPDGSPLVERPPSGEEVILYADVNLALKAAAKHTLDIVGHYSRPDLLSLSVTTQGGQNVQFSP